MGWGSAWTHDEHAHYSPRPRIGTHVRVPATRVRVATQPERAACDVIRCTTVCLRCLTVKPSAYIEGGAGPGRHRRHRVGHRSDRPGSDGTRPTEAADGRHDGRHSRVGRPNAVGQRSGASSIAAAASCFPPWQPGRVLSWFCLYLCLADFLPGSEGIVWSGQRSPWIRWGTRLVGGRAVAGGDARGAACPTRHTDHLLRR